MSGLTRPSSAGPRELKPMMSLKLSEPASAMPHWSGAPKGRGPSVAPTVTMFLAVPGEPMVLAPGPSLPAEKMTTISWLPATGNAEPVGCASRTSAS